MRQRPHRFADLVYAWLIERIAPDDLEAWQNELRDLLPWQDVSSEAGAEIESESFLAMMAKGGG